MTEAVKRVILFCFALKKKTMTFYCAAIEAQIIYRKK
jgi:hypothetical protein